MRTDQPEDVEQGLDRGPEPVPHLSREVPFGLGARMDDQAVASEPPPDSAVTRSALGIQHKILSLVVVSALVPALLAGSVSYFIARRVLTASIHEHLDAQLASVQKRFELALEKRAQATEIFAGAGVVEEALRGGSAETRTILERYLNEVLQSEGSLDALLVVSASGEPVAGATSASDAGWARPGLARLLSGPGIALQTTGGGTAAVAWHPVGDRWGALISVSPLDALWEELRSEIGNRRLVVLDSRRAVLFDSDASSGGAPRAIEVRPGETTGYDNESGVPVLGAHRTLAPWQIGLILEVESRLAFTDIRGMGEIVFVISLLAALLVAAFGALVAVNLSRPITALIRGAESAREGDLSGEIPVTSRDQIGDLTRTFNAMIRALKASRDKLERLSLTDELTGLFNRRYLREVFDKELSRAQRAGAELSVLMLDFDHFKTYNDLFGHLKGDAFLRDAARVLEDQFRASDIIARYGGEEFVALLPSTAKRDAAEIAERVRRRFDVSDPISTQMPRVTLSVGVSTYPEDGSTKEELISAADVALYEAKEKGRNRVELAGLI